MKKNKLLIIRKGINVMTYALLILLGLLIFVFVNLAIISPGKPEEFKDNQGKILEGSISEKRFVTIGGVEQGMFISSKNIDNPVLLYVHGGPGFPNYFLIDKFKPGLEDFFTVCYWEQRGGGLSYTPKITAESMTLDQLTNDAIEVTNYLRDRFGKDKVYILAHSGGTTIALQAVSKAPQLYNAYIAMAQITRQSESEKLAYNYMLREYMIKNDHTSLHKMNKFTDLETDTGILSFHNSAFRDKAMHELGIGTMHNMNSVFLDIFVPVWTCRAYSLKEKINIWKSKLAFLPKTNLRKEMLAADFPKSIPEIDVPVYFISGKYDLTVNIDLSRDYFNTLNAPLKGFYTFENSAHSPLFEEPERFLKIMEKDVLNSKNNLADKSMNNETIGSESNDILNPVKSTFSFHFFTFNLIYFFL